MYQKNQLVKLKNSNSIFLVLEYEKILDTQIYYLNNGISVAEHQVERSASETEKTQFFLDGIKRNFRENSRKVNLMFAQNLIKNHIEIQTEKKLSFFEKVKKKIFG